MFTSDWAALRIARNLPGSVPRCGRLVGFRRQGIGAALLAAPEEWARAQGCIEMASDTSIDNETPHRAPEALGFEVSGRAVTYRKRLD